MCKHDTPFRLPRTESSLEFMRWKVKIKNTALIHKIEAKSTTKKNSINTQIAFYDLTSGNRWGNHPEYNPLLVQSKMIGGKIFEVKHMFWLCVLLVETYSTEHSQYSFRKHFVDTAKERRAEKIYKKELLKPEER